MGPIDAIIVHFMIPFLSFCYNNIIANYGIGIILLTLLVKLLFYPLTAKQYASMNVMKKLNPQIKKIREKYKQTPEKAHMAIMQLYKENNANPLKGCLPGLIQVPVFIAIFYTIHHSSFQALLDVPGVNQGFTSFWLPNLTQADGTFILPILLGAVTFWSQQLMIVDEQQKKMMMFMPIIILVMSFKMPAGVLLYWLVSTLVSTLQQLMVNRQSDVIEAKVISKT
ncbi:MAG: YidC/Oxa1 family membrane protein insertase [bacterium]